MDMKKGAGDGSHANSSPSNAPTEDANSSLYVQITIAVVFGALVLFILRSLFFPGKSSKNDDTEGESSGDPVTLHGKSNQKKKGPEKSAATSKVPPKDTKSKVKDTYGHPLLVATLKGHTATICDGDFSANGRYLATCAEDRSVHVWTCSDIFTDQSPKEIKNQRINMDFDHATLLRFSPDSKALLGRMSNGNVVRVFKLNKKPEGGFASLQPLLDLPQNKHGEIIFMGINCNGKFIMTGYDSMHICLWTLKGDLLWTIVTNIVALYDAKISPCGRFIGASGFTPDVKIWEVVLDKTSGDFRSVDRAFELTGHSSGILAFAFSGDSTHMVSVSKDKTFRLYDVNVEFRKKQDPRLLQTGTWTTANVDPKTSQTQVVLSNDGRCLVIAFKTDILIVSAVDGLVKQTIPNSIPGAIQRILFDPSSGYILAFGGKIVRVFRNLVGYEVTVNALREKIKYASQDSIRQRLQQQLDDAEKVLAACIRQYRSE